MGESNLPHYLKFKKMDYIKRLHLKDGLILINANKSKFRSDYIDDIESFGSNIVRLSSVWDIQKKNGYFKVIFYCPVLDLFQGEIDYYPSKIEQVVYYDDRNK